MVMVGLLLRNLLVMMRCSGDRSVFCACCDYLDVAAATVVIIMLVSAPSSNMVIRSLQRNASAKTIITFSYIA